MGIRYVSTIENVKQAQLCGFFHGWPDPPSPEKHLELLRGSFKVHLAIDEDTGAVVGFISAVSDGVLAAYIPLLEVLPDFRHQGIGTRLMEVMLESLSSFRMVDLMCDEALQPFYERFSMKRSAGMIIRRRP
jgi:ribosomal protein S18 acetylase RimI-like enzyme